MLLAIDAGNTHIVLGVGRVGAEPGDWLAHWRIATQKERTEDELEVLVRGLFQIGGFSPESLDGVAISNVVPPIASKLERLASRLCSDPPLIVDHQTDTGIPILYTRPQDVGPDRIVNAVAAIARYGAPAIVVDYGTATTFDAIDAEGRYLGGAITPGIGIAVEALFEHAARLPRIQLVAPERAIGVDTVGAMRSGILYGYAGQTDAMVRRFRAELGQEAAVVATGGLAELLAPLTETRQHLDPWLTLEGLRLLWRRCRAGE
ncbi:MAG TPA: type III pantothenate kinase [Armatimonadota bacterium]|jgi:type III pantothenate kinase